MAVLQVWLEVAEGMVRVGEHQDTDPVVHLAAGAVVAATVEARFTVQQLTRAVREFLRLTSPTPVSHQRQEPEAPGLQMVPILQRAGVPES